MTSCGRACGEQARKQKNQFGLVEEEKVGMVGAVYLIGRASQDRAKGTRSASMIVLTDPHLTLYNT